MKAALTKKEAAKVLGVSERTVHSMISRGDLRAVRLGPQMPRIPATEIERIMSGASIASGSSSEIPSGQWIDREVIDGITGDPAIIDGWIFSGRIKASGSKLLRIDVAKFFHS